MENVGGMQWRVLEEYDGDCRRNTMKSVAVYENVGGMQWRVSEECDSVGRMRWRVSEKYNEERRCVCSRNSSYAQNKVFSLVNLRAVREKLALLCLLYKSKE